MSEQSEGPMSILLVEDNEIDVEIMKRVLAKSGGNVSLRVARDGQEALELLLRSRTPGVLADQADLPKLVLLDLRLPVIDGHEVLRRIKNDAEVSAIPVAVLTGLSGEKPLLECMAEGGNMYFVKPMTVMEARNLLPAIRKYWEIIEQCQRSREALDEQAA